eukprot:GHVL01032203.1.p1 GENE.GHVL01032203.1~~GHVL01032203.1.p1  ORF type:complete len:519 (+),score=79.83 GHVL01032203.1:1330-2886(+)
MTLLHIVSTPNDSFRFVQHGFQKTEFESSQNKLFNWRVALQRSDYATVRRHFQQWKDVYRHRGKVKCSQPHTPPGFILRKLESENNASTRVSSKSSENKSLSEILSHHGVKPMQSPDNTSVTTADFGAFKDWTKKGVIVNIVEPRCVEAEDLTPGYINIESPGGPGRISFRHDLKSSSHQSGPYYSSPPEHDCHPDRQSQQLPETLYKHQSGHIFYDLRSRTPPKRHRIINHDEVSPTHPHLSSAGCVSCVPRIHNVSSKSFIPTQHLTLHPNGNPMYPPSPTPYQFFDVSNHEESTKCLSHNSAVSTHQHLLSSSENTAQQLSKTLSRPKNEQFLHSPAQDNNLPRRSAHNTQRTTCVAANLKIRRHDKPPNKLFATSKHDKPSQTLSNDVISKKKKNQTSQTLVQYQLNNSSTCALRDCLKRPSFLPPPPIIADPLEELPETERLENWIESKKLNLNCFKGLEQWQQELIVTRRLALIGRRYYAAKVQSSCLSVWKTIIILCIIGVKKTFPPFSSD